MSELVSWRFKPSKPQRHERDRDRDSQTDSFEHKFTTNKLLHGEHFTVEYFIGTEKIPHCLTRRSN